MTYKEKLDMIRQYEADNNISDDKRLKDKPRDIDIDIRYMEIIEIPKERLDEIWDSVWGETNDAESLEWRDELTESEGRYVQLLDEAFDIGMNRLFEDIAKESHRRILVAIESTDDYYDTAFHSDFINADIQNSDGTYGQTRDYYRIVSIDNTTGKLTPFDNRTFVDLDSAKEAVAQNNKLQLTDYDTLVRKSYERITELKKAPSKRLFVDMDGTLCRFHDEVGYLERMFEKGFFESLKPFDDFVYGLRLYMQANPKVEVYILSAAVDGEPPYCRAEKNDWIDQYLPEIDKEHRIFTKVGQDKSDFIPGGIRSTDYLYDDYNKNLEEWRASGGCAIKCKNNINHRGLVGELWNGDIIANEGNPMQICRDLEVKTEVVDITQRFAVFPIRSDEQPRLFDTSYEATLHSRRLEMRGIQSETSAMTQQEFDACTNAKLDVPVEEVPPIDIG